MRPGNPRQIYDGGIPVGPGPYTDRSCHVVKDWDRSFHLPGLVKSSGRDAVLPLTHRLQVQSHRVTVEGRTESLRVTRRVPVCRLLVVSPSGGRHTQRAGLEWGGVAFQRFRRGRGLPFNEPRFLSGTQAVVSEIRIGPRSCFCEGLPSGSRSRDVLG